jgi:hypothetical protein
MIHKNLLGKESVLYLHQQIGSKLNGLQDLTNHAITVKTNLGWQT